MPFSREWQFPFKGRFIVDVRSEPMTAEEAESLVRQGSEDPTMVGVLKELDDIQLKTVSLLEKGKKSSISPSKDNCTSLVVLEMQAYYFYWTLVLLLAGDFSNATRFAKYSDRVYKYLTTFPKELPPRYVHLTIIGNVSDLVCYVKKTFEIGESLNQKGRYGDFQIALIRMFDKAPAGICFNQLYERSVWFFLSIIGAFHLEGVPEESPTRVTPIPSRVHLESASGHVDYPYPQLSVPVVSNFLISRPVLLQICNTYLKTEKFADGASLMARVYPLLLSNDMQMRQKANRSAEVRIPQDKIFSMPCQLITKDLATIYTDKFVDPELV